MNCFNHQAKRADDRCSACAEPFCSQCLVTVGSDKYCESCKSLAIEHPPFYTQGMVLAHKVSHVAYLAIGGAVLQFVSPFFGIVLSIGAIMEGIKAMNNIRPKPALMGWGIALGAVIVGFITITFIGAVYIGGNH